ncbi:phytoene desaturase family protein [soil metagenome]
MKISKAVIIGSGVAGMATAIRLSLQGYQVTVYEKNSFPGGKLNAFEKDGFQFDAGPSLFTQPQNITDLFKLAGEPIENYIKWQPVNVSCNYFYENGKVVHAHTDPVKFAAEMKLQLNEEQQNITRYLTQSEKLYKNIGELFLNNSLHKRETWLHKRIIKALATLKLSYLFQSLNDFNKKQLSTPEAVQLFNRFATYNGSNPYQAPSMLSLIPSLELNNGTFYPFGGMISITNALYDLAIAKGVTFYLNTPVSSILHKDEKVIGIVALEQDVHADIVVSNSDVYFTWLNLLNDASKAKKVLRQERSSSAVIFYWGINKIFKQLHLHNIFFSKDYQNEFNDIFKNKSLTDDPTVYINITSKLEAGMAPDGKENWFVMVNAPCNTGQDWEQLKKELRKNILIKLSRMLGEDIEPLIETEQITDPVLLEAQTGSYMGSLYGTSSNSRLAAFFRHANFSKSMKGLYFCGGSVHPGGGIPLCLKSAQIVSDLIKEDFK